MSMRSSAKPWDNCAASVSEYGACLEETFGQFHELVQQLPSCSTLAGAACDWDQDCAPAESGSTRCVPTTSIFESICAPTTRGSAGDPCLGTVAELDGTLTEWSGGVATSAGGALCHHSGNLRCDEQTGTCIAVGDLGDACTSTLECSSDAYCDPRGACAARLVEGAQCDNYFGECAGEGDCDDTSQKCTLPLDAGAVCSADGSTPCASGSCIDGVCTHPLARLCGDPAGR